MKKQNGETPDTTQLKTKLSRRRFLKVAAATASLAGVGVACGESLPTAQLSGTAIPVSDQFPEVPFTPSEPPDPDILEFLTRHEALTVEMLTARILPGSPDDPGAREAGVVNYIDALLAYRNGFAQPIFREPPYVVAYEGESPPEAATKNEQFHVIWVKKDQLERYGYQSILTPQESYRIGLNALDRYAQQQYQANFVDLDEAQQDDIVGALAEGEVDTFEEPSAQDFFEMVRDHTIQGMFCDPVYGGNRDLVGWELIGYPGAQRAYTPADMHTEGTDRRPQSIAMLHALNPGQKICGPGQENIILPVSGFSEQDYNADLNRNYLDELLSDE